MLSLKRFFAILIGLVFLFSGFTKLVDPVSTSLIISEYFKWLHVEFMLPLSKTLGVLLSLSEMIVGTALVCGVWRRAVAVITSVMLGFFTCVSIFLAVLNPSIECGCFGEYIHLSHFQTLVKNLILCLMAIPAFTPVWYLGFTPRHKYTIFFIDCALIIGFGIHSLYTVPYFDSTSLAASTTIVEEGSWELQNPGVELIPIWDDYGNDASAVILEGDVALISIYEPGDLDSKDIKALSMFAASAGNQGFQTYVLSTGDIDIPGVELFHADYKTIITLNRSNGGVTVMGDGFITDKCGIHNLYSEAELSDILDMGHEAFYIKKSTSKNIVFQGASLLYVLLLLI